MDTSISTILYIILPVVAVSSFLFVCVFKRRVTDRNRTTITMNAAGSMLADPAYSQQIHALQQSMVNNPALIQQLQQLQMSVANNPALTQQLQQLQMSVANNPAFTQQIQQLQMSVANDPAYSNQLQQLQLNLANNPAVSQQLHQLNVANLGSADAAYPPPPPAYGTVMESTDYNTNYSTGLGQPGMQLTDPNSTLGTDSAFTFN